MKEIKLRDETIKAECLDDLNDSQKQELAEKMLKHFSVYLMNTEVEYILHQSFEDNDVPFSYDDLVNNDYTGQVEINGEWFELTEEEKNEKIELYIYLRDKANDLLDGIEHDDEHPAYKRLYARWDRYDDNINELNCMSIDEAPEVFQWFLCPELCYHLEKHGQIVLNGAYWGRQCCGQAIILDRVIQQIAFDLNC